MEDCGLMWEDRAKWIREINLTVTGSGSVLESFQRYYKSKLTVKPGLGST